MTRADLSMMMPLDSMTMNNAANRWKALNASLQALKSVGVDDGCVVGIGGERGS
ncbi:beta-amylase 1 [Quercus suber]|uniref:Beta-amylase 1 n=1 Tax=Quercus suber TaxID=58331 RepID=A0AAW0ID54_QUESU